MCGLGGVMNQLNILKQIKAVSEEAIVDKANFNIYWRLLGDTYQFGDKIEIKLYAQSSDINENFPLFNEYLNSI